MQKVEVEGVKHKDCTGMMSTLKLVMIVRVYSLNVTRIRLQRCARSTLHCACLPAFLPAHAKTVTQIMRVEWSFMSILRAFIGSLLLIAGVGDQALKKGYQRNTMTETDELQHHKASKLSRKR